MEGVAAPSTSGAAQGPANGPPPLHEALSKILSASGGLSNPKHLPALESLLAQQTEPGPRGVLLMVVTMSTPEIQTLIVRQVMLLPSTLTASGLASLSLGPRAAMGQLQTALLGTALRRRLILTCVCVCVCAGARV